MTHIELLLTTILMSLFCNGIAVLFWDKMLLSSVGSWYDGISNRVSQMDIRSKAGFNRDDLSGCRSKKYDKFIYWILKPVIGCVICYASFWGTVSFILINIIAVPHPIDLSLIGSWIVCCVGCCYLNYMIDKV